MNGKEPTVADMAVFAVLSNVFRGTMSFKKLNGAKKVKAWMESMV